MKQLGTQHFRLSIAWTRIFPDGSGEVNLNGLAFYHKVLDALIEANIKPQVTLYHWDMPLVCWLPSLSLSLSLFLWHTQMKALTEAKIMPQGTLHQ
jgi:beta-glucosidase/6-phospho-beta-glucosidase/beta-galactosidase